MDKVAVVILNYNGKEYLEKFLPSVVRYSDEAVIYVADNCSTDDSVIFLKQSYPEIQLVINTENGGFAKGYNDALAKIDAEYYVLLNSDIEVTEGWIAPCISFLDQHPDVLAVQPKIRSYNNPKKFEHAGAAGGFLDKNYYPFCQGRIFEETEEDSGQYDDVKEIFWATGACLFIRSEAYRKAGGLDEDFFAHMEEIDLCWRLKQYGGRIFVIPQAHVFHVGGGTLNYNNPKKTYLNFRNSLYMILKNHDRHVLLFLLKRMALDGLAGMVFLFKLQMRHFWAVLHAHFSFYKRLRTFRKKRKAVQASRTQFNEVGIFEGNILTSHFIKKVRHFSDLDRRRFKKSPNLQD